MIVNIRFQAARNMLPQRTDEAIEALDCAISKTEQAIAEGRDAIKGLRALRPDSNDFPGLLTAFARELADSPDINQTIPIFSVTVEGEQRPLDPVILDEISQIAREALRNAFRHAEAAHIEVEIRFAHDIFRFRLRDDGKGIAPDTLRIDGRSGHWGLPGIRERAKRIGARLDFWSEAGAGTEIQLIVPATVVYLEPTIPR